jgi:hypothetical protein
MFRINTLILTLLIVVLSKHGSYGQGKIEFTNKHPKPGTVANSIDTEGKITIDPGWTMVGNKVVHKVWISGGVVTPYDIAVNVAAPTTWGATGIGGLKGGTTYNVTAEVTLLKTGTTTTATIVTGPATAKAAPNP